MKQLITNNPASFVTHLSIGFIFPLALIAALFDGAEVIPNLWIVSVVTGLAMVIWHHEATHQFVGHDA